MDRVLEHILSRPPQTGSWGRVLDAGTGVSSLAWVSQLPGAHWTAITAEPARAEALRERFGVGNHRILVGNWQDPDLLQGETFDVVIADYLLGSCERYAPHFQDLLLERLLSVCQGWLFLVGQEPWPQPQNPAQQCLWELASLRDSVQLLLGRRPHRELPQAWVERQLRRCGHAAAWSERFSNHYDLDFVTREIHAIEQNLEALGDGGLAQVIRRRCHALRKRAQPVAYGRDYLLAINAKPPATVDRLPG